MSRQVVEVRSAPAVGLPALLGVLFIGLKLTDHIDWALVWLLSPFWIPLSLGLLVFLVAIIIALVKA